LCPTFWVHFRTCPGGSVGAFQGTARLPQNVYDFVWGKYLEEAEYEDRPLSKLTKEILEQMGIKR